MTSEERTENRRGRGRPPGPTPQGQEARRKLYETATGMIAERGYQETTLREIAAKAGVSPGLLYRYFPSKRAVVLALYDELSAEYAAQAAKMRPGTWRARFLYALRTSLNILGPHRRTLAALTPILVGDPEEGLFAEATTFSRVRVQRAFHQAAIGATDAPAGRAAAALGRILYLAHLAVILWWLLDKSPQQRATSGLVSLFERLLPVASFSLRLPVARAIVVGADALVRDALFDDAPAEVGHPPIPR